MSTVFPGVYRLGHVGETDEGGFKSPAGGSAGRMEMVFNEPADAGREAEGSLRGEWIGQRSS
jgi:hypothetical protein